MAGRFRRGGMAYAKDGRSYTVDDVENGMVYCSSPGGAEAEFPESALLNEAEWAVRSDGRRDLAYTRLNQARAYSQPIARLDRAASEQLLAKAERLAPGLLDFAAYTVALRTLSEVGSDDLTAGLSIAKCRNVFDAAKPEVRAGLLATLLEAPPEGLVQAGRLGDNLMRAMLEKGMARHKDAFDAFRDRRRK